MSDEQHTPIEPVTQADRDAVKWFHQQSIRLLHSALLDPAKADMLGKTTDDSHPIYQAFARHRIACTIPAESQQIDTFEKPLSEAVETLEFARLWFVGVGHKQAGSDKLDAVEWIDAAQVIAKLNATLAKLAAMRGNA
jgi:hypothetical protein